MTVEETYRPQYRRIEQALRERIASLRPGELRAQPLFDCATPPLPSLLRRPAFQF